MVNFEIVRPWAMIFLSSLSLLSFLEIISHLISLSTTSINRQGVKSVATLPPLYFHLGTLLISTLAYGYMGTLIDVSGDSRLLSSNTILSFSATRQFRFIIPPWELLHNANEWSSSQLAGFYLAFFILLLIVGQRFSRLFSAFNGVHHDRKDKQKGKQKQLHQPVSSSSLSSLEVNDMKADLSYLASRLDPTSSHYDVLFFVATAPSCLAYARDTMERADALRKERLDLLKRSKKDKERRKNELTMFDEALSSGGWANDEDLSITEDGEISDTVTSSDERDGGRDDASIRAASIREAREARAKAEKEKELLAKQVAEATGKMSLPENILLEGVDDGVLGQKWVERTLTSVGQWPPVFLKKNPTLAEEKFASMGGRNTTIFQKVMDHPGARRTLCITAGRLNSQMLNTHPDLVEAGQQNLIDSTYFKTSAEFRQRVGQLLEGSLHLAASLRSYRLAKTLIETLVMFKVGVLSISHPQTIEWFRNLMSSTYGGEHGIPELEFRSKIITTPEEGDIVSGDVCILELDIERKHADNFTKQKIELCTKQGIPPQIALSAYKEVWWILIRAKKIDVNVGVERLDPLDPNKIADGTFWMDKKSISKFECESEENRLLHMFPFIVPNVTQKAGKLKIRFSAPKKAGKYKFFVDVKSGEFLGCDQDFAITADVIDKECTRQ